MELDNVPVPDLCQCLDLILEALLTLFRYVSCLSDMEALHGHDLPTGELGLIHTPKPAFPNAEGFTEAVRGVHDVEECELALLFPDHGLIRIICVCFLHFLLTRSPSAC
uniref:Uncharacterized protein n=1 Tax=Arundo donax TaxID=35708 RepID=A0A0A9G681_ARUDO